MKKYLAIIDIVVLFITLCAAEETTKRDYLHIEGPASSEYTEVDLNNARVWEAVEEEFRKLRYLEPQCKVAELVKISNAKHRLSGEGPSEGAEYDLTMLFRTSDNKCIICRDTVWVSLKVSRDRPLPRTYNRCNCKDKDMVECATDETMTSEYLYIAAPLFEYDEKKINIARAMEAADEELRGMRYYYPDCKLAELVKIKKVRHRVYPDGLTAGGVYDLIMLFRTSDSKCFTCSDAVWDSLKVSLDRSPPFPLSYCDCTDKKTIECASEETMTIDSLYIDGSASKEYTDVDLYNARVWEAAKQELRFLRYLKPECRFAELVKISNAKHRLYGESPSEGVEYDLTMLFITSDGKCITCRDTVWASLEVSIDRPIPRPYHGCNCTDKDMIECAAELKMQIIDGPQSYEYTTVDANNARVQEAAKQALKDLRLKPGCKDVELMEIVNAKHRLYGEGPSDGVEYDLEFYFNISDTRARSCSYTVWGSLSHPLQRPVPRPYEGCNCTVNEIIEDEDYEDY